LSFYYRKIYPYFYVSLLCITLDQKIPVKNRIFTESKNLFARVSPYKKLDTLHQKSDFTFVYHFGSKNWIILLRITFTYYWIKKLDHTLTYYLYVLLDQKIGSYFDVSLWIILLRITFADHHIENFNLCIL